MVLHSAHFKRFCNSDWLICMSPFLLPPPTKAKKAFYHLSTTMPYYNVYCVLFFDNFRCRCIGLHHLTFLSLFFFSWFSGVVVKNLKMKLWRKNYTLENTNTSNWTKKRSCAIVLIELFRSVCVFPVDV